MFNEHLEFDKRKSAAKATSLELILDEKQAIARTFLKAVGHKRFLQTLFLEDLMLS